MTISINLFSIAFYKSSVRSTDGPQRFQRASHVMEAAERHGAKERGDSSPPALFLITLIPTRIKAIPVEIPNGITHAADI